MLEVQRATERKAEKDTSHERLPTPAELEMCALANAIVSEEIAALGLTNEEIPRVFPFPVSPDRIRIDESPDTEHGVGHFQSESGEVMVSALNLSELEGKLTPGAYKIIQFEIALHEMIHAGSAVKKNDDGRSTRVGYVVRGIQKTSEHEHMRGFNEGVVERLTQEWSAKHRDRIKQVLRVDDADFDSVEKLNRRSYPTEQIVLGSVIDRIAQVRNADAEKVWSVIARGHFSGEMMHLRDVDDAFGRGSLRVLAALGSAQLSDSSRETRDRHTDNIKEHFVSSQQKELSGMDDSARNNLPKPEFVLYLQNKYGAAIDQAIIDASNIEDKIPRDDPRAMAIDSVFYRADALSSAGRRAVEQIEKSASLGQEAEYDLEKYKRLSRVADVKRELLRKECKRIGTF